MVGLPTQPRESFIDGQAFPLPQSLSYQPTRPPLSPAPTAISTSCPEGEPLDWMKILSLW
jgi:hypothetical protein